MFPLCGNLISLKILHKFQYNTFCAFISEPIHLNVIPWGSYIFIEFIMIILRLILQFLMQSVMWQMPINLYTFQLCRKLDWSLQIHFKCAVNNASYLNQSKLLHIHHFTFKNFLFGYIQWHDIFTSLTVAFIFLNSFHSP